MIPAASGAADDCRVRPSRPANASQTRLPKGLRNGHGIAFRHIERFSRLRGCSSRDASFLDAVGRKTGSARRSDRVAPLAVANEFRAPAPSLRGAPDATSVDRGKAQARRDVKMTLEQTDPTWPDIHRSCQIDRLALSPSPNSFACELFSRKWFVYEQTVAPKRLKPRI